MEKITIELRIFATYRKILNFKTKTMQISRNITIDEFLEQIRKKFPNGNEFFNKIIYINNDDKRKLQPYVKIILNGTILFADKALNTQITKDESVIAIFPPVGGG